MAIGPGTIGVGNVVTKDSILAVKGTPAVRLATNPPEAMTNDEYTPTDWLGFEGVCYR